MLHSKKWRLRENEGFPSLYNREGLLIPLVFIFLSDDNLDRKVLLNKPPHVLFKVIYKRDEGEK